MSFRATLALVAVAAGLGLYVYLVEVRGEREREVLAASEKRLFDLDRDALSAIELSLEGGERARLTRRETGEGWSLERPVSFPADELAVSSVLGALVELESLADIEQPSDDLEPFGLGDTRTEVSAWSGDEQLAVLYLGGDAPVGSAVYAAIAGREGRIYTLERWRAAQLRPTLLRLRDKRLVGFVADDVTALRLLAGGRLVVAARRLETQDDTEDASWILTEPREAPADARAIRRLLQDLTLARATGFVDEPGELSEYGLARPAIELELQVAGETRRLELGTKAGKAFIRAGADRPIYESRERLVSELPREFFAFHLKRLLDVDESLIKRLELTFPRASASYAFRRQSDGWTPEREGVEVLSTRLEDVIYALSDLEAIGIEQGSVERAPLGLDPPRLRILLGDAEGETLAELELGDASAEQGMAAVSSTQAWVWRVAVELGEDVPLSLEVFQRDWLEHDPDSTEEAGSSSRERSGEDLE